MVKHHRLMPEDNKYIECSIAGRFGSVLPTPSRPSLLHLCPFTPALPPRRSSSLLSLPSPPVAWNSVRRQMLSNKKQITGIAGEYWNTYTERASCSYAVRQVCIYGYRRRRQLQARMPGPLQVLLRDLRAQAPAQLWSHLLRDLRAQAPAQLWSHLSHLLRWP